MSYWWNLHFFFFKRFSIEFPLHFENLSYKMLKYSKLFSKLKLNSSEKLFKIKKNEISPLTHFNSYSIFIMNQGLMKMKT